MKKLVLTVALAAMVGCASQPEDIDAQYVSDRYYKDMTCDDLQLEAEHVNGQASQLFNKLNSEANADAAQFWTGMLLFWPALFFLEGGDGADAATYARLKGEMDAIQKAAHKKGCRVTGPTFGLVGSKEEAIAMIEVYRG